MLRIKKLFIFSLILISITILVTNYTYADESSNNTSQDISFDSILGDKIIVLSMQTGSLYAIVDGNKIKLDYPISNSDKQMLVPAKFIAQALGGNFDWNAKSKTISITKKGLKIVFQLKSKTVLINGKKLITDQTPVSLKNVNLIPLKLTVESFGAKYEWNSKLKTSTIKINTKTIKFPDSYLEASIRSQIKKPDRILLLSDVVNIEYLNLNNTKISDLSGLQYLIELQVISLSNNNVSDLTPLSGLVKLKSLFLANNKIKDITPLGKLSSLKYLDLSNNLISEISVITNLKKLETIKLWDSKSIEEITKIYQKSKEIIASVIRTEMSDLEKELALHDYLVTHTKYDQENYDKHSITPEDHDAYGVFKNNLGVCDGYAEAMQVLLNMCGIECTIVIGDTLGPKDSGYEDYGHAWNVVKIDGSYYQLDVTFDDPVLNNPNGLTATAKDQLVHTYFNLSDKQMSLNHKWDRSKYPTCSIDNDNFNFSLNENKDTIITENWIYKIFKDNLYRFKPGGTGLEKICSDNLYYITFSNDYIFYLNKDDNNKIYRIKSDGTEKTKIIDGISLFPFADGDFFYYLDKESSIFLKSSLDGNHRTQTTLNAYTSYINIYDGWIYYRAFDWNINSKLYKVRTDFTNRIAVIDEPLMGFDLSNNGRSVNFYYGNYEKMTSNYVFYISKNSGNKIFKVKNDGTEKEQLNDTDSSEIEVCGAWVYYVNNSDGKYYRAKTDGTKTTEFVG